MCESIHLISESIQTIKDKIGKKENIMKNETY